MQLFIYIYTTIRDEYIYIYIYIVPTQRKTQSLMHMREHSRVLRYLSISKPPLVDIINITDMVFRIIVGTTWYIIIVV
jgi:hypothetical protein